MPGAGKLVYHQVASICASGSACLPYIKICIMFAQCSPSGVTTVH